jgi:hypothetical protein
VQRFLTIGATGNGDRIDNSLQPVQSFPTVTQRSSAWSAGPFAELGGIWMAATNLSLGATWGVNAFVGKQRSDNGVAEATGTRRGISFGNVALVAAIYF